MNYASVWGSIRFAYSIETGDTFAFRRVSNCNGTSFNHQRFNGKSSVHREGCYWHRLTASDVWRKLHPTIRSFWEHFGSVSIRWMQQCRSKHPKRQLSYSVGDVVMTNLLHSSLWSSSTRNYQKESLNAASTDIWLNKWMKFNDLSTFEIIVTEHNPSRQWSLPWFQPSENVSDSHWTGRCRKRNVTKRTNLIILSIYFVESVSSKGASPKCQNMKSGKEMSPFFSFRPFFHDFFFALFFYWVIIIALKILTHGDQQSIRQFP